mgnify:CR=1 FL=1
MAIWEDIKSLITVERINKPEPPLLAADQAFYLHENLKLRLLAARIALLQHDEATYKADLNAIKNWLNEYFDTKHPDTIKALNLLKKLSSNNISIELPQLTDSFAAVNRFHESDGASALHKPVRARCGCGPMSARARFRVPWPTC